MNVKGLLHLKLTSIQIPFISVQYLKISYLDLWNISKTMSKYCMSISIAIRVSSSVKHTYLLFALGS